MVGLVAGAAVTTACQPPPVRSVGPGRTYAKPCQAIAAAQPGDVIQIDAAGNGTYDGDVCTWTTNNLTIEGVNGRARIDAAGRSSQNKATWVIAGNNTTVRNVELSGAVSSDKNGAGIRAEGANLTVVGSYFHHNQDGILAGANPASSIVIDGSEFADNGANDGQSHNMYIGHIKSFTLIRSYSHESIGGQLVKSRAITNYVLYNQLLGRTGTSNYELDLPNGGLSYVIGNSFQQGPATANSNIIAYGMEGVTNPSSQLYVVNNTIVNDRGSGTAVLVGSQVTAPVVAKNNISVGSPMFVGQASAQLVGNCVVTNPGFVNRAAYDFHLVAGSPCVDTGTLPGTSAEGFALEPTQEYVNPLSLIARTVKGSAIDAGAFERP
ncbi:MAG: hypothetical protein ABIP03_09420 [Aquihabitans sp.]